LRRLPAEWELQSFIQFTFPHKAGDWAHMFDEVVHCFVTIIHQVASFEPVLVGCKSVKEVSTHFKKKTQFPIHLVEVNSNDTWARDHGAISVLDKNQPLLLDFTFNGWGRKFDSSLDNQISQSLAQSIFSIHLIEHLDFVLEGGSIDSNGQGVLLTTSECLLSKFRNPSMDKIEIEAYLKQVFGLKKILWLAHGNLAGDDTDAHIDTLARFIDEHTIAYVKCDNSNDEHFETLNNMELQLKSFTNLAGEPFNLIPIPFPDKCLNDEGKRLPATYANFLFVNEGLIVPTYGVNQDSLAIKIFKQLFPDRNVIGVDCRPLIAQNGSLHCITMQYPASVQINI